jgi:hypothetical protein
VIEAEATRRWATDDKAKEAVAAKLRAEAAKVFDEPKLRRLLIELKQLSEITRFPPTPSCRPASTIKLAENQTPTSAASSKRTRMS